MSKMPPGSGGNKSMAQMWKEFGDFMNARDVKGNPRAQGNAVKKRASDLTAAIIKKGGGGGNIPGGGGATKPAKKKSPKAATSFMKKY